MPTFRAPTSMKISVGVESYRLSGNLATSSVEVENASSRCNTTVYRKPPKPTFSTSRQRGSIHEVQHTTASAIKPKESISGVTNTGNLHTTAQASNVEARNAETMLAVTLAFVIGFLHMMFHYFQVVS
jgi:hypothetical protein